MPKRTRGPRNNSGGPKAPRLPNGNVDWNALKKDELLPTIEGQRAPNTGRGLMYIFHSKQILKKSDYDGLIIHLRDWRKDGTIPWEAIADGSGRGLVGDYDDDFEDSEPWVSNFKDALKDAGSTYLDLLNKQWRWTHQPKYLEFMTEKQAVTGTAYAYVKNKYVRISYNKGNNAWVWAWQYANHLRGQLHYYDVETGERKRREKVYVKYLGDDDKVGRHMDLGIKEQLNHFGILDKIHFERIAVLPKHVKEYGLPSSSSVTEEDSEAGGYDIDALNAFKPKKFEELLLKNVNDCFNEDIHKKLLEKYSDDVINELVRSKVKFLDDRYDDDNNGGNNND